MARAMMGVILAGAAVLSGAWCVAAQAEERPPGLGDELFRIRDGRTMRSSSSDPDWRAGNHDSRRIMPGETLTIADVEGPGIIRHIWFTVNPDDPRYGRSLTLRMYWDNQEEPAVESPFGDFFAVGHGMKRTVDSLPVSVTSEGRAYNCYWPMPFAKHARVTLTNDSPTLKAGSIYFYVDYERVPALPPDAACFHAQYRQEFPAKSGQNYLILDAEGKGHYVGTVLSVYSRTSGWFGEGDDFFTIDGETEPSLRGTGTEDYFCDAWGFREFNRPYYGVVIFDGFDLGDRISAYRWHLKDPVRFGKSLKVEIEHKGVMANDQGKHISSFHERADLFSSVAFWYQTGKAKRFATLPPADQRVVPQTLIRFGNLAADARSSPPAVTIEPKKYPGGQMLLAKFREAPGSLTVPFKLDARTQGIARLRLGTMADGGIWSVSLDGQVVEGATSLDLHAATIGSREVRIGLVDLPAGEHTLAFACKARNPASQNHWLGVDSLAIDQITPYSVPAAKE